MQCLSRQRQFVCWNAISFVQGRLLEGVDGRPAAHDNCAEVWGAPALDERLGERNQRLLHATYTTLDR
jgi:hypothetical protein